jgi:general secretion pathway protein A
MYEQFFGLVDTPFRLTPDPRYLFRSRKHEEVLAHLRLSLSESSGFACITGDIGTGKTTLLRAFLADLGPDVTVAYICNPARSALELLRRINQGFGLATAAASRLELIDVLNAHLLAQSRQGGLSVVVIDEAQALSAELLEQLRLLSNLETATEKLLRIVLVGQPQLRNLLLHPALEQLNQRITLRWHMGPLTRRETFQYVRHRLRIASQGSNPRVFTWPALWLLQRLSGGVARLVNMIAHRAMLAAFVRRRGTVTLRFVLRAYREISAVPLPGSTAARRWAVRLTAATAVGVCLATLGAQSSQWSLPGWRPGTPEASHVAPSVDVPDAPQQPAGSPELAPGPAPVSEIERRLTASPGSLESARGALESILAAWHVQPLVAKEMRGLEDVPEIVRQRGLETLALRSNRSMLRIFDLPALLEVQPPGVDGPRHATLMHLDEQEAVVLINGAPVASDVAEVDRMWTGRAYVIWRDFENLGGTFGRGAQGPRVARFQRLLRRAGYYAGVPTGEYDQATEAAVLEFQRAYGLVADGLVGQLTRIVLYARAGGYPHPALAIRPEASS